ncbi:hypothetical protein SB861_40220 [Paraburkholderia sp. SIMBA_049]
MVRSIEVRFGTIGVAVYAPVPSGIGFVPAVKLDAATLISRPWCIVGQNRLDKVLSEHFAGLVVDIHHHPVLLMPDPPADGLYIPFAQPVLIGHC